MNSGTEIQVISIKFTFMKYLRYYLYLTLFLLQAIFGWYLYTLSLLNIPYI